MMSLSKNSSSMANTGPSHKYKRRGELNSRLPRSKEHGLVLIDLVSSDEQEDHNNRSTSPRPRLSHRSFTSSPTDGEFEEKGRDELEWQFPSNLYLPHDAPSSYNQLPNDAMDLQTPTLRPEPSLSTSSVLHHTPSFNSKPTRSPRPLIDGNPSQSKKRRTLNHQWQSDDALMTDAPPYTSFEGDDEGAGWMDFNGNSSECRDVAPFVASGCQELVSGTDPTEPICTVCFIRSGGPLSRCSCCGVYVHRKCYDTKQVPPDDDWRCSQCNDGMKNATCVICYKRLSPGDRIVAMKESTAKDKSLAHMFCALWVPETSLGGFNYGYIRGINEVPRTTIECKGCPERGGACIKCNAPDCSAFYHPLCGQEAMAVKMFCLKSFGQEESRILLCPQHAGRAAARDNSSINSRRLALDVLPSLGDTPHMSDLPSPPPPSPPSSPSPLSLSGSQGFAFQKCYLKESSPVKAESPTSEMLASELPTSEFPTSELPTSEICTPTPSPRCNKARKKYPRRNQIIDDSDDSDDSDDRDDSDDSDDSDDDGDVTMCERDDAKQQSKETVGDFSVVDGETTESEIEDDDGPFKKRPANGSHIKAASSSSKQSKLSSNSKQAQQTKLHQQKVRRSSYVHPKMQIKILSSSPPPRARNKKRNMSAARSRRRSTSGNRKRPTGRNVRNSAQSHSTRSPPSNPAPVLPPIASLFKKKLGVSSKYAQALEGEFKKLYIYPKRIKDKALSFIANMKEDSNKPLLEDMRTGWITPCEAAAMKTEDLASPELRALREKYKKDCNRVQQGPKFHKYVKGHKGLEPLVHSPY